MSGPTDDRMKRMQAPTVRSWTKPPPHIADKLPSNVVVEMGWGRLLFGHTFDSSQELIDALREETPGRRDIAFYLRDPHVVLSLAPTEVFLDPSHTYRLWSHNYVPWDTAPKAFAVRRLQDMRDAEAVNHIYARRKMAASDPAFMTDRRVTRTLTYFVAESTVDGTILATVTGVDHVEAFEDPENGSSLWCLAVDPQVSVPGLGESLVRHLVEHYFARGRAYVDLSVMHDNSQAIRLYEKLGFQRVPVFAVKHKNPINEPLFTSPHHKPDLNVYARIIVDEAIRRGINVDVVDADLGYFSLAFGGRVIHCRESLSELTSAIAFSRCDDKRMTHRILRGEGISVPDQREAGSREENAAFLAEAGAVVVKPARGEQGRGVSVDLRTSEAVEAAVARARSVCPDVVIENLVDGEDLRVIVIDYNVVAAAVRRPPVVTGTGTHTIEELIGKVSRRREAATGGESTIPRDEETVRCVEDAGYRMDAVLERGKRLTVRRTANLHTGGTIHDVTPELHPDLAEASVRAARALEIPVVGLDLLVDSPDAPGYTLIEANERPGLANHEPQPTAERFIDLLFPQTRPR